MDLRPQTQSQGASNNTNRPGSSVANEAFDNHERLVVPYHLNGSKQAATLIVCGAVIDQAGSPTPVAIVWLVDPLRDSNQPIDLSSHPYFVRALAQSLKDNAELTLISPSEVKDSMNVNDVHPELNNLESTLIVQSA
ncbi:MAG: hypothetical protein KDD62_00120, partial [Bdellovibrionales bacterium]|nr:hypothetical protein [Bdellovibrionales bacterium]